MHLYDIDDDDDDDYDDDDDDDDDHDHDDDDGDDDDGDDDDNGWTVEDGGRCFRKTFRRCLWGEALWGSTEAKPFSVLHRKTIE